MFEQIFSIANIGHTQAELAMTALRFLGEDIMEFNDNLDAGRRSDLSQALKLYMPKVLPFVQEFIKSSYTAMVQPGQPPEELRALEMLVDAGLHLLQSYCWWLNLVLLHQQRMLPLCCSLLADPRSRVRASECLFLLCDRKLSEMDLRGGKRPEKFEDPATTAQSEAAKLQFRELVSLLHATPLPEHAAQLLDEDAYTFAKQLAKCVACVGDKQLCCFDPPIGSGNGGGDGGHTQHVMDDTLDAVSFGQVSALAL